MTCASSLRYSEFTERYLDGGDRNGGLMTEFARPSPGGAFSSQAGASEVAIVGAGRVGCSIGRALAAKGHRIVAASTASSASAARVRQMLGDVPVTTPEDAALAADLIVIAVPDDALGDVAVAVARGARPGATVIHTSGLHGLDILAACGQRIAAIHPAQAIPAPGTPLDGVYFGVTAGEAMRDRAREFVAELGGIAVDVPEDRRALYHAALCMASNFAVSLAGDAADLLPDPAILAPLLRGTVGNIIALGADASLTGPVVRGDAGTVRAHLAALPPHLLESYVANARRTLDRAVQSGRLDANKAAAVAAALQEASVPR